MLSNDTTHGDCGTREIDITGLSFYYGESIILNVTHNILSYPLQVFRNECMINKGATASDARILFSNSVDLTNAIVFDHVVVIPFRSLSNLFHFTEGANTLIRFALQYKYPVMHLVVFYVDSLHLPVT